MAKGAYYNEIDPLCAQWLRNLIAAGHIAPGDVDERSIEDVRPDDVRSYTQCHFFAGIGVWSHALRRAGWDDKRPVWTGSCPCQPFSAAGKGVGFADERHLWPAFHHLICECSPPTVIGEQVAAKDGLAWLDLVQADLEAADYAVGAIDLCSAGFGAPHIRQRLYFVAHHHHHSGRGREPDAGLQRQQFHDPDRRRPDGVVAHHHHPRLEGWRSDALGRAAERPAGPHGVAGLVAIADDAERRSDGPGGDLGDGAHAGRPEGAGDAEGRGEPCELADHHHHQRRNRSGDSAELPRRRESANSGDVGLVADADGGDTAPERQQRGGKHRQQPQDDLLGVVRGSGPTDGFWRTADWLLCRDPGGPRWRPARPGSFPLAASSPGRVGRLRAYGNAITADVATEFIAACMSEIAERDAEGLA